MATETLRPMDAAPRDGSVIVAKKNDGSTVSVWWDKDANSWLTDQPYDADTMVAPSDEPQEVAATTLAGWRLS